MITVDESDPIGEVEPKFPFREVTIQKGIDAKQLYDVTEEIGRGKFGTVYKIKEKSTGMEFAGKFIAIPKKEERKNVEREVEVMNTLQHPKIIQLYNAYEFGRMICVVLELVEGGELFDRVLEDKFILTEKACAIFMRQICEAMAYIKEKNIIHLDLKPENILCLTESGNRIKIIDFGLAREYDPDKKLQVLFGTPEFVAPEVVNFDSISFATDMWSVGVVAYVLVSGLSPFAGETDIETMANVTISKYDFIDEAFDNVSADAIDFISKLLVKDQNERMTAAEALKHKWVKKKPQYYPTRSRSQTYRPVPIDTHIIGNKENLKELVDKWHINSNDPYVFDKDRNNIISPMGDVVNIRRDSTGRRGSLSSKGSTSSPTGSNCSIPDMLCNNDNHDNHNDNNNNEKNNNNNVNHEKNSNEIINHLNHHIDSESSLSPSSSSDFSESPSQPPSPLSPSPCNPSTIMPDAHKNDNDKHNHEKISELILIPNNCLSSEDEKKTEKLENEINKMKNVKPEVPKKPDFLLNNPIRTGLFKLMPKSVSLCNEDKIFRQNFSKFFEATNGKMKSSIAFEENGKATENFAIKRTKFRINQMSSRDVPTLINSFSVNRFVPNLNFSALEKMDSFRTNKAISLDWDESEVFEHRSEVIQTSMTSFFQVAAKSTGSVKQMQAQIEAKNK